MKKYIIILLFSMISTTMFSQDIEVYRRLKNDNFIFPKVPTEITFNEFQLLERHLTMKEMLYSMVVPGYTHFYTHENKLGYTCLGIRAVGYSGYAYILATSNVKLEGFRIKINDSDLTDAELEQKRKTDQTIFNISTALVFGSYFYDWIHGQYILYKKQEEIRYKYRITAGLDYLYYRGDNMSGYAPAITLKVTI